MKKNNFKNSYFAVDVEESYSGTGITTVNLRMDFEMRYPNDGKAEPKYKTNKISWENDNFGLNAFASQFNERLILNAYINDNVGEIGTTIALDQILALGICFNIHYLYDEKKNYFSERFLRDEDGFYAGIYTPFLSNEDKLVQEQYANQLVNELRVNKVEVVDDDTIRVFIDDVRDCIEIKRVNCSGYKFTMQVSWYQTEQTMIED